MLQRKVVFAVLAKHRLPCVCSAHSAAPPAMSCRGHITRCLAPQMQEALKRMAATRRSAAEC